MEAWLTRNPHSCCTSPPAASRCCSRLKTDESAKLTGKLAQLVKTGAVETVTTKDGAEVAINFAHVAAAYVDDLNRKSTVFGMHA